MLSDAVTAGEKLLKQFLTTEYRASLMLVLLL